MRKVISKIDHSLSSVYGTVSLLLIFVIYLVIGAIVNYFYGPKIAYTLVFNGPFFAFLLSVISLSLILGLLKKRPFRRRFLGVYFFYLGLIILLVVTTISSFTNKKGRLNLISGVETDTIEMYKNQALIRNRQTGETLYVDLDFSIRPQGLNLDFGPVYLISYLPFSRKHHAKYESRGENSVSILGQSRYLSNTKSQTLYLTTNQEDYRSTIVDGNLEILLFNQLMLKCLDNLSTVNPDCSVFLRRKSITDLKSELCVSNKHLVKEDGFYSLGNNCRLDRVKLELVGETYKYRLLEFKRDTALKLEYRYSSNYQDNNSDILKYYEKGNTQKIYQMKLGEKREIIDYDGRFYDLKFQKKPLRLPFDIQLEDIDDTRVATILINGKKELIKLNDTLYRDSWLIKFDSIVDLNNRSSISLALNYEPWRFMKIVGFSIFCFGIMLFGLGLLFRKSR
ncbi:hypothetical protein M902_2996 [Bacteriovorax sp. BAL6_X]|uniref:hypothetical protein n=1 Tax=Bacteriovorax sp. BAL6_X TaxID=1201290 RepID=UPI000385508F|nr:hypothetical protein [Bacteriovorax sp. BAL6_X]EPZ51083.1 hypothetical protein M902_2996 [Bacteriovorax sp. BAL6_X]